MPFPKIVRPKVEEEKSWWERLLGAEEPTDAPNPTRPEAAKPEEEESFADRFFTAPNVVRVGLGAIGATPGVGAITGGGSEIIAQMMERGLDPRKIDWRRVGSETMIGGLFGGLAKGMISTARAGKVAAGAAKGMATAATTPIVRHGFEEGDWNPANYPGEIAAAGLTGGIVGGGTAKLFGQPEAPLTINPRSVPDPPTPPAPQPAPAPRSGGPVTHRAPVLTKEQIAALPPEARSAYTVGMKPLPTLGGEAAAAAETDLERLMKPAGVRVAKSKVNEAKKSLKAGTQDTRPSEGGVSGEAAQRVSPVIHGTLGRGIFAVADPTLADPSDIANQAVRIAVPEEASEATLRARAKAGNPKMADRQLSSERSAAKQATRQEATADLAMAKEGAKLQNQFAEAMQKRDTEFGDELAAKNTIANMLAGENTKVDEVITDTFVDPTVPGGTRVGTRKISKAKAEPEEGLEPLDPEDFTPGITRHYAEHTGFKTEKEAMVAAMQTGGVEVRRVGRGNWRVVYPKAPVGAAGVADDIPAVDPAATRGTGPQLTEEELAKAREALANGGKVQGSEVASMGPTEAPDAASKAPSAKNAKRVPKTLEDIKIALGITAGTKPFEKGMVVANDPVKGVVLSADRSVKGKVDWAKSEFPVKPPTPDSVPVRVQLEESLKGKKPEVPKAKGPKPTQKNEVKGHVEGAAAVVEPAVQAPAPIRPRSKPNTKPYADRIGVPRPGMSNKALEPPPVEAPPKAPETPPTPPKPKGKSKSKAEDKSSQRAANKRIQLDLAGAKTGAEIQDRLIKTLEAELAEVPKVAPKATYLNPKDAPPTPEPLSNVDIEYPGGYFSVQRNPAALEEAIRRIKAADPDVFRQFSANPQAPKITKSAGERAFPTRKSPPSEIPKTDGPKGEGKYTLDIGDEKAKTVKGVKTDPQNYTITHKDGKVEKFKNFSDFQRRVRELSAEPKPKSLGAAAKGDPDVTGVKPVEQVILANGKRVFLRIEGEDDRFLRGIEIDKYGDEVIPKGPEAKGATERLHLIEKNQITKRTPYKMNNTYAIYERVKGAKGETSPATMAKILGAGVGAATGAATNDEDRFKGMLIGGGLGLAGGAALAEAPSLANKLRAGATVKEALEPVTRRLPNYTRGSMLYHPLSILYNSLGGPYGSQTMGGVEQTLKGIASGDVAQKTLGQEILKRSNPLSWWKTYQDNVPTAAQRIWDVEADMGRYGVMYNPTERNIVDDAMSFPAIRMFAGDLTARGHIADAGGPEDLAQRITLTAEPRRILTKAAADFGKRVGKSPLGTAVLPFVRTAANIAESGAERTPGLGYLVNYGGDDLLKKSFSDTTIEQGIGGAVYYTAYQIGQSVDPDTAKQTKLATLISNLGGQYAMLAGAGFIAGQASRRGDPTITAMIKSVMDPYGGMLSSLPFPNTQTFTEAARPFFKAASGNPPESARDYIPDMLVPKFLPVAEAGYDNLKGMLEGGNNGSRRTSARRNSPTPRQRPQSARRAPQRRQRRRPNN